MNGTPNFHVDIVGDTRDFASFVGIFIDLIRATLPVIAGLALLVFMFGLAKFIFNVSGDAKAVDDGKNLMIWGTIALFLLVSFWAIIGVIYGDFGFGPFVGLPFLPQN